MDGAEDDRGGEQPLHAVQVPREQQSAVAEGNGVAAGVTGEVNLSAIGDWPSGAGRTENRSESFLGGPSDTGEGWADRWRSGERAKAASEEGSASSTEERARAAVAAQLAAALNSAASASLEPSAVSRSLASDEGPGAAPMDVTRLRLEAARVEASLAYMDAEDCLQHFEGGIVPYKEGTMFDRDIVVRRDELHRALRRASLMCNKAELEIQAWQMEASGTTRAFGLTKQRPVPALDYQTLRRTRGQESGNNDIVVDGNNGPTRGTGLRDIAGLGAINNIFTGMDASIDFTLDAAHAMAAPSIRPPAPTHPSASLHAASPSLLSLEPSLSRGNAARFSTDSGGNAARFPSDPIHRTPDNAGSDGWPPGCRALARRRRILDSGIVYNIDSGSGSRPLDDIDSGVVYNSDSGSGSRPLDAAQALAAPAPRPPGPIRSPGPLHAGPQPISDPQPLSPRGNAAQFSISDPQPPFPRGNAAQFSRTWEEEALENGAYVNGHWMFYPPAPSASETGNRSRVTGQTEGLDGTGREGRVQGPPPRIDTSLARRLAAAGATAERAAQLENAAAELRKEREELAARAARQHEEALTGRRRSVEGEERLKRAEMAFREAKEGLQLLQAEHGRRATGEPPLGTRPGHAEDAFASPPQEEGLDAVGSEAFLEGPRSDPGEVVSGGAVWPAAAEGSRSQQGHSAFVGGRVPGGRGGRGVHWEPSGQPVGPLDSAWARQGGQSV